MAVLLLLMALIAPGIAQNSYCPTQCHNTKVNITTRFLNILPNIGSIPLLDNTCLTYFQLEGDRHSYLSYLTGVLSNGTRKLLNYIVTPESPNVNTYSGSGCTFTETTISKINQMQIILRRKVYGECSDIIFPFVVAYPCLNYGSTSDLPQITQVLRNNGVSSPDPLVLPRRLRTQCVDNQLTTNTGSAVGCPCYCP